MLPRHFRLLFAGILGTLAVTLALADAPAQPVAVQPAADPDDGPDVLARGPVHEAFASTVEMPKAGEISPKMPPDAIEELPPDQKPEGDNVQWIPGYWDWDDERTDYIWISGFWRVPPPNHVWVPGSWNKIADGWQWTSGFWQLTQPNQPQPDLEYLPPPPPQPIESGPSVPAPDETSVYVTGSWVYRGRYFWRPGYWIAHRPGWVWVPAHYRWSPLGYIFINGYWDYPLASRGVLFAPVYYPRRVFAPGYFYTPRYVVATPVLFGSLFIRSGYSSYYFGDYYTVNYGRRGWQPWCAPAMRGVAVVPARGWSYDPLWNYYSMHHRQTPQWSVNIAGVYAGRYDGSLARPPRTLVQQNQVIQRAANINNVQNVTNNITVVNNTITVNNRNVTDHVMVAPLSVAPKLQSETKLQPITQQVRQTEAKHAGEIRQVAVNRQRAEAEAVKARPAVPVPAPGTAPTPPQPVKVKIDVPKAVVARAQVNDEKRQPPPAPVLPKFDPKIEPKINPMPKVNPKIDPTPMPKGKIDPVPMPKGKVDPPKFDPVPMPKGKVDPPKVDPPKVDPPKPVNPPKVDPPKVDPPKPVVPPKVNPPKVDPPKVDPPKPVVPPKVNPPKVDPPKVDPPKPVVPPKVNPPKVDPPKVDPPKPVVPPRVDPPRVDPPKPPPVVIPPRSDPPKPPPVVIPPKVNPPKPPVVPPKVDPPKPPPVVARPIQNQQPAVQPRVSLPSAPVRPIAAPAAPRNNPPAAAVRSRGR